MWQLIGFGAGSNWGVHNNSLNNLIRGLVERVYKVSTPQGLAPPPKPLPNVFRDRLQQVYNQITRRLPRSQPCEYETFVQYYRGRKRTIYQRAVESLVAEPVRRVDAWVKAFVKAEKINFSSKPDPAPRLIQPRSPRYNAAVGVFLRPLEPRVYDAIAKVWGGPTVLKGMNSAQQAAALREMWDTFANPVAVGLDASRFDQHVSRDALEWEHSVYLSCFGPADRRVLKRLLGWQVENVGRAYVGNSKVKYQVEGCRMSGDINTSLGNCLIMCSMVLAYAAEKKLYCRLANNGDDCVVIMERNQLGMFLTGLPQWFREMGFTMEIEEPVFDFERIEFCQSRPVWGGDMWIMCRNPDTAISKDLVSLLNLREAYSAYVGAIGECGLAALGGMPVFQEFYLSLSKAGGKSRLLGEESMAFGLRQLAKGMNRGYREIDPLTRASFAIAWGVQPDEQRLLEQWLRDHPVPTAPRLLVTPIVSHWYK